MPKYNVSRPLSNGLSDLRVLRSRRVILFQKNVAELIVPVFQFCAHFSCPAVSPWWPSNDPDDKKRSRNRRTRRKAKTARNYYCFLFGNVTFQQNRSRWKVKQHYFPEAERLGKIRTTKKRLLYSSIPITLYSSIPITDTPKTQFGSRWVERTRSVRPGACRSGAWWRSLRSPSSGARTCKAGSLFLWKDIPKREEFMREEVGRKMSGKNELACSEGQEMWPILRKAWTRFSAIYYRTDEWRALPQRGEHYTQRQVEHESLCWALKKESSRSQSKKQHPSHVFSQCHNYFAQDIFIQILQPPHFETWWVSNVCGIKHFHQNMREKLRIWPTTQQRLK